jgi:hypothetical protein
VVKEIPPSWPLDHITHYFTVLLTDIWKRVIHGWRLCYRHWDLRWRSDLSRSKYWISTGRTPTYDRVSIRTCNPWPFTYPCPCSTLFPHVDFTGLPKIMVDEVSKSPPPPPQQPLLSLIWHPI